MGIYGKCIPDNELYTLESIEVDEEVVQESLIATAVIAMGSFMKTAATIKKVIDAAMFIGAIGFQIVKMYKEEDAKDKLKAIEKALKEKDSKFIPNSKLTRRVYSCQKFYDNNITRTKELKGIAKIFGNLYPDRAYVYSTEDGKEIFTYFSLSDVDISPDLNPLVDKVFDRAKNESEKLKGQQNNTGINNESFVIEEKSLLKANITKSSKFYFKMNDKSLEKYKYYYLTVACLESGEMTKEALNWINATYKSYENSNSSKG